MSEDTKQPGSEEPVKPGVSDAEASGTPPPSAIPPAGTLAGADAEKASMVEQAKARVAAVKEALEQPAAAGAPKPPVKKKEEGPKPTDASGHPLVKKLKAKFGEAIGDASEFIGQLSVHVDAERIVEICNFLKNDKEGSFNYLSDLTCVHYPDRRQTPFEIVYNLFSIEDNERVRLKAAVKDSVESVTSVWPAANPLEFVENSWTENHLPVMTEVEVEQLQQRRAYGLEILSVPQERIMRDIFRGGKEVMPKDK